MRPLTAAELLDVWERGHPLLPMQRALLLLTAACPDQSPEQLACLPIGQRDRQLLTLREWMFGPQMVSLATCPSCGDRLELNFQVADIQVPANSQEVEVWSARLADYDIQFRLPNSLDLAALSPGDGADEPQQLLLQRCLVAVYCQGEQYDVAHLPSEIRDGIAEQMALADPQADVRLALACSACGHQWQATFDIVSFLWDEIRAWAYRTLRQVHLLASAYGWREGDILAMSAGRRQLYLDLVGQS